MNVWLHPLIFLVGAALGSWAVIVFVHRPRYYRSFAAWLLSNADATDAYRAVKKASSQDWKAKLGLAEPPPINYPVVTREDGKGTTRL
jgi:hypothetical protein